MQMIISDRYRVVASLALLLSLILFRQVPLVAQTGQQPPVLTPADRTVPGFSVLDSSLMSIEHVNPLHATSITFFSTLRNDDLLPRDIAFEHLLALLPSRGNATTVVEQYSRLAQPRVADTLLRYLGVSLAISQDVSQVGADEPLSQVSLAVRTFILDGRFNSTLVSLIDSYRTASAELDKEEAQQAQGKTPGDANADERFAKLFLQSRVLSEQIAAADKTRVGFLLEAGAAQALDVPRNTLSEASGARRAAWVSPIYRFERIPVDVAGLMRYIDERQTRSELVDFGGRVGARRNGVLFSLEGLGRKRLIEEHVPGEDPLNGRVVGAITYGFNRSTQMMFTFGKNYKNDFARGGSLLVSFGLTIGLGESLLGAPSDGQ